MASLRVNADGMHTLAERCVHEATGLRSALAADRPGPGFQPTSAVIGDSDTRIDAACQLLAQRVDDLAAKLTSAADAYLGRDEQSAAKLGEAMP
jgi:hypothetical protein